MIKQSGKSLGRNDGEVGSTTEQMIATRGAINDKIKVGRAKTRIDTNRSITELTADDLKDERKTKKIHNRIIIQRLDVFNYKFHAVVGVNELGKRKMSRKTANFLTVHKEGSD